MNKKLINNSNSELEILETKIKKLETKIEKLKKKLTDTKNNLAKKMKIKPSELDQKLKVILENHDATPYEKKLSLFNVVKNLDVGEMESEKKKRTNWLLQGHLYNELAKNCMDEYRKSTVESFSK